MRTFLLIAELLLCLIISSTNGHLIAGTISGYFYNRIAAVQAVFYLFQRLTYRLVWERGSGPCGQSCSAQDVGNYLSSLPPTLSSLKWRCTTGCQSANQDLHDVSYTLTAVSDDLTLSGYEVLAPSLGLGKMVAAFDFGIRNDTGVPNASPISAVPATLGVQFGCTTVINIPAEDPDADSVRCRLATPEECGNACTNAPNITLNWTCSVSIPATTQHGYEPNRKYVITVMVEDYPDYTISVGDQVRSIRKPISKIPSQVRTERSKYPAYHRSDPEVYPPFISQFTITTIVRQQACGDLGLRVDGVVPNPTNLFRVSYGGGSVQFNGAFYMQSPNINDTTFITSFFKGVNYNVLPDDENRTIGNFRDDVRRARYVWGTYDVRQYADTLLCVWGHVDDCGGHTCQNGGKCVDLFRRWTCKCPHGFKPKDCSHSRFQKVGSTRSTGDDSWGRHGACGDGMLLVVSICCRQKARLQREKKKGQISGSGHIRDPLA
uniref:Uncharacterized protein n=1 Tax=Magallana gigas TaxID=29159 RepID=K1RUI2_MAGGI